MSVQIALVTEFPFALITTMYFVGGARHVVGIVADVLVASKLGKLSEAASAFDLRAFERLLVAVDQYMLFQVSLDEGSVRAVRTGETLVSVVRLRVLLQSVAVGEALATLVARQRMRRCVQFGHVNAQIGLPTARGRTEFALKHRLLFGSVRQSVRLQTVALRETHEAHFAFVRLLPRVNSHVPLQFVRVWTRILAVLAPEIMKFRN